MPVDRESEQLVLQIFEAYVAAVFAKDTDAFVALYDDNVRVFDMWGVWSYDGLPAWREMVAGWFGSLGQEWVVVETRDVHVIASHDIATAHALVTFKSVSAEGTVMRSMQNRLTWALRQHAGTWKIVHEHTSAPIDLVSSKVMLGANVTCGTSGTPPSPKQR